jgi:hypothetical protein
LRAFGMPQSAGRDGLGVALPLATLLAAGIGLRCALMAVRGPAFLGYSDTYHYIEAAQVNLLGPPSWPAGYPLFLRGLHALDPNLSVTIVVQHALGVATALLLFAAVRRVAPGGWALIPAAVVLLAGPQLMLEHAPLSEALFTFLVGLACYCAVRALGEQSLRWASAAGLAAAAGGCVRPFGLLLIPLAALCLVVGMSGSLGRRLGAGAVVALTGWLLVAAYVGVAQREMGYLGAGLSRAGGWAPYVRVASFADCGRFELPPHARVLCERRPPSDRPPGFVYLAMGPAQQAFGSLAATRPQDDKALNAFARAAIVHQPADYLHAVGTDLLRLWSSKSHYPRGAGSDYDTLMAALVTPVLGGVSQVRAWYSTGDPPVRPGLPSALRAYERHTRLEGPGLVLLILLALIGLSLARGRRLAAGVLIGGAGAALLIVPIATLGFDVRYAIPAYGPLAAAGAIGAATLVERIVARRSLASSPP